jgi:TolB-like protein
MSADEEGTLAALKVRRRDILQPLVAKHHGRVVKVMGDGVLVEFASAINAVACSIELQEAMDTANADLPEDRRIVLRVGINLGDVIAEGSDLYGDGINVAARLEALAEHGSVVISGKVRQEIANKLKLSLDDLGEQNLKNIPEVVRVYRVSASVTTSHDVILRKTIAGSKPSIAVLPFTNMSGDPEQEYFSDGITEDIITELSRFRPLSVIARNSSFQFRGKSLDMREVGQKLGARYLVEGSVRRVKNQVRINAQLIEASSGNHLWADRYDRELADVFAVQDEVTRAIVSHLAIRLEDEVLQVARRKPPQDMRAYDLWLQGKRYLNKTAEGNQKADEMFRQAVAVDPGFARAYAALAASCLWRSWYSAWTADDRGLREEALQLAQEAVALDDTDHLPHIVMAWVHHFRRETAQARRHLDRALALNSNDADALAEIGNILVIEGEPEMGIACIEGAIRLNPHHPDDYLNYLAHGLFFRHNYTETIQLLAANVVFPEAYAFLAAAYAHAGELEKARTTMRTFLEVYPKHWKGAPSARRLVGIYEYKRQEDVDLVVQGMCNAGMPE